MDRGYQNDFYELSSSVRDPIRRLRKARKIRWALENFSKADISNATCLDLGCSSGIMTADLSSLFKVMIGMDYDSLALGSIHPTDKQSVYYAKSDAMKLPLQDCSVDVVICAQVYEHVPDSSRLFNEIHRILRPGGIVYFSGPNWLFPIEPHYFIPFLHWLPEKWANSVLKLIGASESYYERSSSSRYLRRQLRCFSIYDMTPALLHSDHLVQNVLLRSSIRRVPQWLWRFLGPLHPNFNWILVKPPK